MHPAQIKPMVNELVMQLYWLIFPNLTNQRIVQELAIYNACQ